MLHCGFSVSVTLSHMNSNADDRECTGHGFSLLEVEVKHLSNPDPGWQAAASVPTYCPLCGCTC